jgi:hypothetical protein
VTPIVYFVQVAEYGEEEEVVGVIKACTRMVSRGKKQNFSTSKPQQCKFVKVACLLALRVSPSHRYKSLINLRIASLFHPNH